MINISSLRICGSIQTPQAKSIFLAFFSSCVMVYVSLYCWEYYLGGDVRVYQKEGVTPTDGQSDHKLYYNLSCPFEWSKYSCVHQGQEDRAMAAQDYALHHMLWQHGDSFGSRQHSQKRRRLLMVGDSTMRQLFIALGCRFWLMENAIEEYKLDWAPKIGHVMGH